MSEMKPEDVIMALDVCVEGVCDACPYNENPFCRDDMMIDTLALLREKDAEIERLKAENAIYENGVEKVAENYHRQGRAEAITEFALRLKSCEFYEVADQYDGMQYIDFCDWVDKIAKELKEDQRE